MDRPPRQLIVAELLSIGTELTVGDTRDTNSGELARSLTAAGVRVTRITALPDDRATVAAALRSALDRVDLVVSTGGLGPTPDDLTREAIADVWGETPVTDPALEAWLRDLWARRGMALPEMNLKQAWLIPSAVALANPNGTAPGWLVTRADGRVAVALPGPPREMRPMWADEALPRLGAIGLGADVVARTYRLTGIGESQVAERLGEPLLRSTDPIVATYARAEAVDVRISAVGRDGRTAESLVEEIAAIVQERVGTYVWATGETTWAQAIGARLDELGWSLALVEIGTGGSVGGLLADVGRLHLAESIASDPDPTGETVDGSDAEGVRSGRSDLIAAAERVRRRMRSDVGLAVRALVRAGDLTVSIAVVTPDDRREVRRDVFLSGPIGRSRAALAAAAVLLDTLPRVAGSGERDPSSPA